MTSSARSPPPSIARRERRLEAYPQWSHAVAHQVDGLVEQFDGWAAEEPRHVRSEFEQQRLGGDVARADPQASVNASRQQVTARPVQPHPQPHGRQLDECLGPLEVRSAEAEHRVEVRRRLFVGRRADGLGSRPPAVVDGLVDRCQGHGGGEVTSQLGEHRPAITDVGPSEPRRRRDGHACAACDTFASTVSRTRACSNSKTRPPAPRRSADPPTRVRRAERRARRRVPRVPSPGHRGRRAARRLRPSRSSSAPPLTTC